MEQNIEVSDDVYSKPAEEGWVREVVYSKAIQNRVTTAYYLSPEDKEGRRKRMKTYKSVDAYIKGMGSSSTLSKLNFCFTRRLLGLGSEHEKTRISSQVGAGRPSIFSSYFTHNDNSCPPSVTCNLCSKTYAFQNFSRHMTMIHLPDETCSRCNMDFPARIINKHSRTCNITSSKVDLFLVSSTSDEEAFGRTEKATETSNETLGEEASVTTGDSEKFEEYASSVTEDCDKLRKGTSVVPEAYYKCEEKGGVSTGFHEKLEKDALFVTEVKEKLKKKTILVNKAGERLGEEASFKTVASDTLEKEVIVKTGASEWLEKETKYITEAREKLEKESSLITGASKKLKETVRIIVQSRRKKLDLQVNKHKRFKLAMKKVARWLSKEVMELVFTVQGSTRTLTGREVMGSLEGELVVVTECEESG